MQTQQYSIQQPLVHSRPLAMVVLDRTARLGRW